VSKPLAAFVHLWTSPYIGPVTIPNNHSTYRVAFSSHYLISAWPSTIIVIPPFHCYLSLSLLIFYSRIIPQSFFAVIDHCFILRFRAVCSITFHASRFLLPYMLCLVLCYACLQYESPTVQGKLCNGSSSIGIEGMTDASGAKGGHHQSW
jgi:hypothetical protein